MPTVYLTIEPWKAVDVTDAEYLALQRQGLIYTGATVLPPAAYTNEMYDEADNPAGEIVARLLASGALSGGGGSTPDATTLVKGKLMLAGDLGGTADLPTVPGLAAKAPLASPTFTGTPAAPTPSAADNTTKLATTAFVKAAIDAVIAAAPGALNTLDELAAALGDDANFAATITTLLALKAPLASPVFTGNPTAPTPSAGDNDTSVATTAFVNTHAIAKGLVDAKGDLIAASANDTPVRVAVGANGTFLKADSSAAGGVAWATAPGSVVGSVHFEVKGSGAGDVIASSTFSTYPLNATPTVNVGGGSWNSGTYIYTIPSTGLYLCLGSIKITDGALARSTGVGIGTSNVDAPHFLWGKHGGDSGANATNQPQFRNGMQYTRLCRFTAGDQVRMYIYSEGVTFPVYILNGDGQFMMLLKVAD
jgi:hypothetical protein